MTLWDLCIRRPVFTTMLVACPIVLGLASYPRLGVDLFPNVDLPVAIITTTLPGASVEEMESSVTKPIEEIANTVSGIDELRSTTMEGFSQVVVNFNIEKNGQLGVQEVRDRVSTILAQLPDGTRTPVIDRFDLDASPVVTIVVSGDRDPREVTHIAKKLVKENLEWVDDVGAVFIVGGQTRAINIIIDSSKVSAYGLSIEQIRHSITRQNLEMPGGRVDQGSREAILRTMGRLDSAEAISQLIVTERNGHPIRIADLGRVEDSIEEPRAISRLDGKPAVSIVVQKQTGANTVAVVQRVKQRLREIEPLLPPGIRLEIIRDQSRFVEKSIEELQFHLLLAAGLVSLTILLFIRDWRTTVIAMLSIPVSIIGTFAFMDAMGFTLNNITMLGLILAVGIVIDDAVVVHENIFRHMEEYGRSAWDAASEATREIALAVVATTLSLLVIFIPVAFMSGTVGRFFNSFGFTVGFAILLSMGVGFTMTPALCARFLVLPKNHHSSKGGLLWRTMEWIYLSTLSWSLRRRWVVVVLTLGIFAATPALFDLVGKEFVVDDDQSQFLVEVTLPEGCSLERASTIFAELEARLAALPGVQHLLTTIGDTTNRVAAGEGDVTSGSIYVRLPELEDRPYSQFDVMRQARAILAEYPELRGAVTEVAAIQTTGFRQVAVDLNLRGPDLEQLEIYADDICDFMRRQRYFVDIDTSLSLRKPELRLQIDRERAADLGISVETIASSMRAMVGGVIVSKFKVEDEQYDVWLRADRSNRTLPDRILSMSIPTGDGGLVQLGGIARLVPALGPSAIERHSRQRQVVITANLEGKALGDAVADLKAYLATMNLPPDYPYEFLGRAKLLAESNTNFLVAFLLSFLFMYMILAAQFESLVHPITILIALPLTLPCAVLGLLLTGTPLDIYATFGLFMLFGIVKKNGILQVDYTNQLRQRGMERTQAILEANRTRLRPILMTTVMLIAAMIPIAMGKGPGASARASMAIVIMGGQFFSLLLTLLVTPVSYSLFDDGGQWMRRVFKSKAAEVTAQAEGTNAEFPEPALVDGKEVGIR